MESVKNPPVLARCSDATVWGGEGGSPVGVVGGPAFLVEMFEIALIVTVVYVLIDRPGPDGSRPFR